jgi:DNA-binding response OmpR family regulator
MVNVTEGDNMGKKRILVVDDNTVNLAVLEKELSNKYTIIPMISGRRALKFMYTEKVDLILLDVQMPVMDGIQTLKAIRNQENGMTVPVIFLTASKDKETVIEGSKLGIMDYITKPFDVKTLEKRIDLVFKRLGIIPFEKEELYSYLDTVLNDINEGHLKQAILRANELIQYQMDEEISGRMINARNKLDSRDTEGAINTIKRLQRMLGANLSVTAEEDEVVSNDEIILKLDEILAELGQFKTKAALEKAKELRAMNLKEELLDKVAEIVNSLKDFDDETAENQLRILRANLETERWKKEMPN